MHRRLFLFSTLLAGCAGEPVAEAVRADGRGGLLRPWRTVPGGFLAPPVPGTGLSARAGSAMYVKWIAPTALALRNGDLLVADLGTGRLWRADTVAGTLSGLAAAPVGTGTALALGADLSAWVLDPAARQVLRIARDGRLLQTFRSSAPTLPRAMALDATGQLLLADGPLGQWSELRPAGAVAVPVQLVGADRLAQVDALAVGRAGVMVLDGLAGCVHVVQRDGRVTGTLGQGELVHPMAIAIDRHDRVFVLEASAQSLRVLQAGRPSIVLTAAQLGVQQIGGLAADGSFLAVSDRVVGQVVIHQLADPS